MAADGFNFMPAVVPEALRGGRGSKYAATVESVYQYLQDHKETSAVKIDLQGVAVKLAVTSFRNAIKRLYPDSLRLVQRGDELYIERR
jgi:hypothetical protein